MPRITPETIPHGTYAGYNAHHRLQVPMCERCRAAGREYMRNRRRSKRHQIKYRWENNTRARALVLLSHRHPEEFKKLLDQVRAETPEPKPEPED